MDVGIGLPTTIPGASGEQILEWARRAEARGFSSLGTIDRIVYGNYEPLIALAAAAAVTERIRLTTAILSFGSRSCRRSTVPRNPSLWNEPVRCTTLRPGLAVRWR